MIETPKSEATRLSVALQCVLRQGVPTLPLNGENNSAPYISEPFEVAGVDEGQLFNTLFDSMLKRKAGVMWKPQVKAWVLNGAVNTHKLTSSITDSSYSSRVPLSIQIYYPKKRVVKAIPFRDRIWQGYLNDHYVYPYMTRSFIWANMASQVGKGTDKARELLEKYLWKFYCHHGREGYVLQIDVRHYYQTIPHNLALELFKRKLPPRLYSAVKEVLDVQYPDSFYAGSQMVQILGISYLNELDRFIKENLHVKFYIRYQDDFLLISDSEEFLLSALASIRQQLALLELSIHEKKTHILPLSSPFYFLGFYYQLEESGRIYKRVNPASVKHERYILRKCSKRKPLPALLKQLEPYLSHIRKGNDRNLEKRLITYTRSLYENN